LIFAALMAVPLAQAESGLVRAPELVDLGANVDPHAINNNDTVVGAMNTDLYPATAFKWTSTEGFTDLDGASANAVNDIEQIVGTTTTGSLFMRGCSV
jgi:hypothetical protein